MFTLVTLLAIRGQETPTTVATPARSAEATLPPRQIVIYVTDPPVDASAAPADPAAVAGPTASVESGDPTTPIAGGGAPDPGVATGGGVAPSGGAAPVAAAPAPAPTPAAPAPAPTTPPPAPSTGTGGS